MIRQKHDNLSTQEHMDSSRRGLPQSCGEGSHSRNSKNVEAEGEKKQLAYGIADILRAKLNSQGNDSFTFGLEKSDSKQSISNNEGLSHSVFNEGEADADQGVDKLFTFRENRPIQRQGSGYTSPSKSTGLQVTNKLQRWSSSKVSTDMLKALNMPIQGQKDEEMSEDSSNSKESVPFKVARLRQNSAMIHRRARGKLDEDRFLKSPSTFQQRYLESKLISMSKTGLFHVEIINIFEPLKESEKDKSIDFFAFSLPRITKSKVSLTQYCELRDTPALKNTGQSSTKFSSPIKTSKLKMPPTPEKSGSQRSFRKSAKYAGISIDVELAENNKPLIDPYALFKVKANSHDLADRGGAPPPREHVLDSQKLRLLAKLNDPLQKKMKDCNGRVTSKQIHWALVEKTKRLRESEGRSEQSDEKSMFSEFSELKRSQATIGVQSTSKSAVVWSKHSPRHRQRKSDVKKHLRDISEIQEGSASQAALSSPRKPSALYTKFQFSQRAVLFIAVITALLIEALFLVYLNEE